MQGKVGVAQDKSMRGRATGGLPGQAEKDEESSIDGHGPQSRFFSIMATAQSSGRRECAPLGLLKRCRGE